MEQDKLETYPCPLPWCSIFVMAQHTPSLLLEKSLADFPDPIKILLYCTVLSTFNKGFAA